MCYKSPSRVFLTLLLAILISLMSSGCQRFFGAEPTPTPLLSSFNPARGMAEIKCPFTVPPGMEVTCGTLDVPEDYAQLEGDKIKIFTAIIHSPSETPASDAIVILPQNAGMSLLDSFGYLGRQLSGLLDNRDLVYYEYRGLGQENVDLNCPEYYEAYLQSWLDPLSPEEEITLFTPALKTCKERMLNNEIDVNVYTIDEMAADLNMLRLALGYTQFDLLGGGYGSDLALVMSRDYPQAVRSVALFELSFPKTYLTAEMLAMGMQNSLDTLFNQCLEDEKCRMAYPALEQQFYAVIDQLNSRPAEVKTFFPGESKLTPIRVSGNDFLMLIHDMLLSNSTISQIPRLIDDVSNGDPEKIAVQLQPLRMSLPQELVLGLELNAACEGLHPNFWQTTAASRDVQPVILETIQADWRVFEQLCPAWTGRALGIPAEQAITNDVPFIVFLGEYNPDYTPVIVVELLRGMKNAVQVVVPNVSNDIFSGDSCAGLLLYEWLNEPSQGLDTSCINNTEPITFRMPDQ